MGAQETKPQGGQDFKAYMERFIDKGKVSDKLYGEGKLVVAKATKTTMFVKEYTTNDENSFKQQMKRFDDRCKLKHPNLVDLQGFTFQSEPQFCSTIYKTYLLFEYCTKNLEGDINQRKLENSRYYSVKEIWGVLQSYVTAFAFLQSRKLVHGDVRLANLFIAPNGDFKVAEQGMLNPNSSFAQIISSGSKDHKGIYLSPLLLKAVETMNLRPKHNIYKSDVFSLGVCIISAALLESCDDIYNFSKYTVNEMNLEEKLEKMKIQFPPEFVAVLSQMVQIDEKNRLDFVLLEKFLEEQKKLFSEKSQPPPKRPSEDFNTSNQLIYSNKVPLPGQGPFHEEEKYKEPAEQMITFKQESNHSSPQFESAPQYRKIPESTHGFSFNEPLDKHREAPPQQIVQPSISVTYQQQPASLQQQSVSYQTQSVAYQPQPVAYQPQTVTYQPQPVAYQPQPVAYQPQTVAFQAPQEQFVSYQPQPQKEFGGLPVRGDPFSEEKVKRSGNPNSTSFETRETTVTKNPEHSGVAKPFESPAHQVQQVQVTATEGNYRSVADYPVNYDDINALLKKYGIEPLQPLQSVQTPQKTTAIQTTLLPHNEPSPISQQPAFQYQQNIEPTFGNEQKPIDRGYQNYSDILQKYEVKPVENANKYGFEGENPAARDSGKPYDQPAYQQSPLSYEQKQPSYEQKAAFYEQKALSYEQKAFSYEQKTPPFYAEAKPEFQQLPSYGGKPEFPQQQSYGNQYVYELSHPRDEHPQERGEQVKRSAVPSSFNEPKPQTFQGSFVDYNKPEFKTNASNNEMSEFNNSDAFAKYSRPSDMNAPINPQRISDQGQQNQKPASMYENVSFANEFFDTRKQDYQKQQHEEVKKKSSLSEMKKSINNPDVKEVVIENYQNGAKYEGEKLRGMRHGRGRLFYSDGGVYDGEWKENQMYGKGVLYYGSGKIAYEGDWVEDKFEGQGILYNETPVELNGMFDFLDFDNIDEFWVKYEGGFHYDNKDGYGVLYLTNGEKYVGYFKDDFMEGRGMFYKSNGELVSGMWRSNKFVE